MSIIDTHCHYNLEPLFSGASEEQPDQISEVGRWQTHWQKAQEAGVTTSIVVGTNVMTSYRAVQLCRETKHLYPAVALHPTEVTEKLVMAHLESSDSTDEITELLTNELNKIEYLADQANVVAIGECGLDYYHLPQEAELVELVKLKQKEVFGELAAMAKERNLPLICHVRDKDESSLHNTAYWDALEILQQEKVTRFVLHCVSGPAAYVQSALELGGYIGFDGNITYPKADHLRSLFAFTPEDRRVVETDAPYLPPQEFRGKVCEPWMIKKTVEYMQEQLHTNPATLVENSRRLFQIES